MSKPVRNTTERYGIKPQVLTANGCIPSGGLHEGLKLPTRNALIAAVEASNDPHRLPILDRDGRLVPAKVRKLIEDGFFDKPGLRFGPTRLAELRVWAGLSATPDREQARFDQMANELRAAGYKVTKPKD